MTTPISAEAREAAFQLFSILPCSISDVEREVQLAITRATEALQKENEELRKCCDYTKDGKPVLKGSTLYLCPGNDPNRELMKLKTPDVCCYCWYSSPEDAIDAAMNKEGK